MPPVSENKSSITKIQSGIWTYHTDKEKSESKWKFEEKSWIQ